ncbi:MAG: Hsp20 family protein [Alphaproteobacteria bacterium]|nr:Hsp20 family protein [Alphaproteobacteria bacterium]MBU0797435.1 Hsp20 family protein [Alphaproteobacteria bacterium]MBU0888554.1 Hsp20 family protein [Alphaproteobacteria bacterium]MBU1813712.1 Hsp20 family protein [Alphaproteobacteria bacterium]MBU2090327.1 Hsp20 family protein [Alphaproteobacteria bacterium]
MTRMSVFNSPFVLGFDHFERAIDRINKASPDGYPPYNIEQIGANDWRISLAVAGFRPDDLEILVEDSQLLIRGRQADDTERVFVHRGIAARQFQRNFVLAEGMTVTGAELDSGLLHVTLNRPEPQVKTRRIEITTAPGTKPAALRTENR